MLRSWIILLSLPPSCSQIEQITISFDGGSTKMNFAEAALLIQGSTCVYSKKVLYMCLCVCVCVHWWGASQSCSGILECILFPLCHHHLPFVGGVFVCSSLPDPGPHCQPEVSCEKPY